jgi:pyruvoyl-dependent arginine decarboxylase (PvlArgDC)
MKARATEKLLSEMTPEQLAEHEHLKAQSQHQLAALEQERATVLGQAQAQMASYEYLTPEVKKGAAAMLGSIGGIGEKITEDATHWLGLLKDEGAAKGVQLKVNQLVKDGVPAEEAYGIALQAYHDARDNGKGRLFGDGAAINIAYYGSRVDEYKALYARKKGAESRFAQLNKDYLEKQSSMLAGQEDMLYRLSKGEKFSNISGTAFDSQSAYDSDPIFGKKGGTSGTETTPGEANNKSTGGGSLKIDGDALLNRMKENQARAAGGSTGGFTSMAESTPVDEKSPGEKLSDAFVARSDETTVDPVTGTKSYPYKGSAIDKAVGATNTFLENGFSQIAGGPSRILKPVTNAVSDFRVWAKKGGFNDFGPQQAEISKQNLQKAAKVDPAVSQIVIEEAKKAELDPGQMLTVMMIESRGNPKAENASGADGLFQFMPKTAKEFGITGKTKDPRANAAAAAKYLKRAAKEFENGGLEMSGVAGYLSLQQGVAGTMDLYAKAKTGEPLSPERLKNMRANIPNVIPTAMRKDFETAQEYIDVWDAYYQLMGEKLGLG